MCLCLECRTGVDKDGYVHDEPIGAGGQKKRVVLHAGKDWGYFDSGEIPRKGYAEHRNREHCLESSAYVLLAYEREKRGEKDDYKHPKTVVTRGVSEEVGASISKRADMYEKLLGTEIAGKKYACHGKHEEKLKTLFHYREDSTLL